MLRNTHVASELSLTCIFRTFKHINSLWQYNFRRDILWFAFITHTLLNTIVELHNCSLALLNVCIRIPPKENYIHTSASRRKSPPTKHKATSLYCTLSSYCLPHRHHTHVCLQACMLATELKQT